MNKSRVLLIEIMQKRGSIGIETHQIILGETYMTQPPIKPNRAPEPAMPRWVKIFVAAFIVLVLVVIAMHLAGVDFGGHVQHLR
jgi:hypothetical protein